MYNLRKVKDRESIVRDANLDGDDCPVDGICDSIPDIVKVIFELEEQIKGYKGQIQKLQADNRELDRKLNNVKSQKFRYLKKKGKI
jgi:hypothetical protein